MKFKCHKCNAETEFNKDDYIGFGSNQELGTIIKMELRSSFPKQKSKEVIINCSNPNCRESNKITIKYYER